MNAFGIDLGTTNSCIAILGHTGQPHVFQNFEGLYTTPSVVYFGDGPLDSGEIIVGQDAKNQMVINPQRTVSFIKRQMSNPAYRRQINPHINISPALVSALILRKLVCDANESRRADGLQPINKAVISVPAYFGHNERALTKQAGHLAGLRVIDIINEPTAAALSYGGIYPDGSNIMVYDLGGGTFDVSIMRMRGSKMDTISTDGNQRLGGKDWDEALLNYALQRAGLGITVNDIADTPEYPAMMLNAENCKKQLSRMPQSSLRFTYQGQIYVQQITRTTFEEITVDLLEKTINIIRHAFAIAIENITPDDINEIILVGGSSYMPMVINRLRKEFSCNIRLDPGKPDRAVAEGAAIYAAQHDGFATETTIGNDLSSHSYGMRSYIRGTDQEMVFNLIKRDDPLVFDQTHTFCTRGDKQTSALIQIYETDSVDDKVELTEARLLEKKEINWGSPVDKDTNITLHVIRAKDGIVHIEAECQNSRARFDITPRGLITDDDAESLREIITNLKL